MANERLVAALAVLTLSCSASNNANNTEHDAEAHGEPNHHHGTHDLGQEAGHSDGEDAHHGSVDLGAVDFGSVTVTAAAREYCECLLITCHDPFHEKYGDDDADAIGACQVEASGYPVAGSAQMSGDSIECRQYHCDNVGADVTCADALGEACR